MSIPRISFIKHYIRQNIRRIRRIGDVAKGLRVSAETLRRVFRREAGEPLSAYISATRIAFLQRKLIRTRRRCFELIYEAGFTREDCAARTFRRHTGMTMEQFRKRQRHRRR